MGKRAKKSATLQSERSREVSKRRVIRTIVYVSLVCMFLVTIGAIASVLLGISSGTVLGTAGAVFGCGGLCGFAICFRRVLERAIEAT